MKQQHEMKKRTLLSGWQAMAALSGVAILGAAALGGCGGGASAGPGVPTLESRIVFASDRDGNLELYSMKPDGTDPQRLTNSAGIDTQPSWSFDRRQIAFASNRDGNFEIYLINRDGTNPRRLTNSATLDLDPAFAPDGQSVLFVSNRDGNAELYRVSINGGNPQRVTNTPAVDELNPAWRRDGQKIAFAAASPNSLFPPVASAPAAPARISRVASERAPRSGPGPTETSDIVIANPDGSNRENVTSQGAIDTEPTWSPDGQQIAFSRTTRNGSGQLYIVDSSGENLRLLFSSDQHNPVFAPDAQRKFSPLLSTM